MSTLLQILKPNKGYSKMVRDPWKMSRSVHHEVELWAHWGSLRSSDDQYFNVIYQDSNDKRRDGYSLRVTSANTWQTLADVTNPKGGYLRWIMLPSSTNSLNNTIECRITVDGREYNFDYTNSYSTDLWKPFIGDIKPGKQYNDFGDAFSNISELQTNYNNRYTNWLRAPADGQWVTQRGEVTIYNEPEYKHISQLRYENNIKVEVKMSALNSVIYSNYALANISTPI